jgi:hypothetical protein
MSGSNPAAGNLDRRILSPSKISIQKPVRGIIIEMRRKRPDEKSERLRSDRIFEELKHLRQKAMRRAKDNLAGLTEWEPQVPATLNDRARD